MTCPKCKYQNLHGANFCEKCGLDLKAAAKAAANPVPSPVPPYGYGASYGSGHGGSQGYGAPGSYGGSGYSGSGPSYTPSPRPTAAPPPVPAPRAGQAPPAAPPTSTPAAPAAPPKPERPSRGGRISAAPPAPPAAAVAPEPPRRPEPLPFGRLVSSTGSEFPLRYDDNLVGRSSPSEGINPMVDLSAADSTGSVSRRHARIGKDDSSVYVEDLGSSNGTRLNGQVLRAGMQTPLNDGDEIVFGSLQFHYRKIS